MVQNEPEPAVRKSYQAVERDGEIIRVRDTVLLKSGPRKKSMPYVAKISALWEDPKTGTEPAECLLCLCLAAEVEAGGDGSRECCRCVWGAPLLPAWVMKTQRWSSMAFIQVVPGAEMLFNHKPGTGYQNLPGHESTE